MSSTDYRWEAIVRIPRSRFIHSVRVRAGSDCVYLTHTRRRGTPNDPNYTYEIDTKEVTEAQAAVCPDPGGLLGLKVSAEQNREISGHLAAAAGVL